MSRSNEMAKRSSIGRTNTDYVQIPDESGHRGAVPKPWSYLKKGLAFLVSITIIVTLLIGTIGVVNLYSPIHAGCELTAQFSNPCSDVHDEISSRILGQYKNWHDPHNNGTYKISEEQATDKFSMERTSGSASTVKYVDKVKFLLSSSSEGTACDLFATSDSQVFSILDFGTNFCNINNLYCSDESCRPFKRLTYTYKVNKCTDSTLKSCYTV